MTETTKLRSSPGGTTESGMIYEQIEKDGSIQYAVKTLQSKDIKLKPHLEMGPHVMYSPLNPSPWLLPSEPELYSTFQELWQELRQFIYEHLDLENDILYDILVAWVLASWTPERWETVPYLHFHGPSNSGKTRGLDVLNMLAYRPLLSPSVSASSIYRALDAWHPTFLLDEFEMYEKMKEQKAEVIGILNAGYKKGQYVLRTDKVQDGAPTLKAFSCFGFKAIGSIQELPNALSGRVIRVPMSRSIRPIKRLLDREKAKDLRSKLLFYRFETVFAPSPSGNPIDLPDGRLIELYTPLCMVSTPEIEAKILRYALSQYKENINQERITEEAKIYMTILEILEEEITDRIKQESIRTRLNAELPDHEQMSKQKIASLLRRLGFESEPGSKKDEKRLMKVKITADVLERRKNRYVLPEEMNTVVVIIEKVKEREARLLAEVKTLDIVNSKTVGTLSTLSTVVLGGSDKIETTPLQSNVPTVSNVPTAVPFFEHCYFCQNPIMTDDWTADEFTANKPAHRECYEKQKAVVKA